MAKRFVLVGAMTLAQGTLVQIYAGTLLSAAFMMFQVQATPYTDPADDYLATASSFCLVTVFLCCIGYKHIAMADQCAVAAKHDGEMS